MFTDCPTDTSEAIMAVDHDGPTVRVIYAVVDIDNEPSPYILEHRSFRTLKGFQNYWRHCAKEGSFRIGLPGYADDMFGLEVWLKEQGAVVESFARLPFPEFMQDFLVWDLPESFQNAYSLACCASYRVYAARVASELWGNLLSLQHSLKELCRQAHVLNCALPPPPPPGYSKVPF